MSTQLTTQQPSKPPQHTTPQSIPSNPLNPTTPLSPQLTVIVCRGHSRPVVQVSYSEIVDKTFWIASGCLDGQPQLRNGETGDWVGTFEGHKGAVWWCCLDKSAKRAATASADFTARIWDALNGNELHSFVHKHIVKAVNFNKDGNKIVTGGRDALLKIFDLQKTDAEPLVLKGHTKGIQSLVWRDDNILLSCSTDDKSLRMWDLRVSNEKNVKQVDESDPITSMENCYFEGGKYILLTTGKSVKIYDSASFNLVKEFKDLSTDLESASLSMDGQFFVTGGLDNCVRLYEFASGKEIDCHKGHHGAVHAVKFAPDGISYVSGADDATLRIWINSKLQKKGEEVALSVSV